MKYTPSETTLWGVARKVVDLFEPRERWKMVGVLVALLATGVLQMAGLASIMPFIGLVANPELVSESPWLARLYASFGFASTREFLIAVGLLSLALFALSNAFTAFTMWVSLRFVWTQHHRISAQLLEQYVHRPYSFYLTHNTAMLSRTLLNEVKEVVSTVVVPGMDVIAKGVTTLFIVVLLVLVEPVLALLVAFGLGGAYLLVFIAVRRGQVSRGTRRLHAQSDMFRIATETFGGIKDIKVLGREAHLLARYSGPSREYGNVTSSHAAISMVPQYAMETIAFGAAIIAVLYLLHTRESLDQVLPTIALYAVAGTRLMPSLHRIFNGLSQIRFHTAALDELHADLCYGRGDRPVARVMTPAPRVVPRRSGPRRGPEVRFEGVSFQYPESDRVALRNVDLTIPANSTIGLVGPTGCGKTTLVDLLLGLFDPTAGRILIDGAPLDETRVAEWRGRVGYVPQGIYLSDDTIRRNIAYGLPDELIDEAAVRRAARAAHLDDFVTSLTAGYDTIVGERGIMLSGGERQRIGIARALYHDPDMLVMDEATSALDGATEDAVMTATRELADNRTIVLIAHRLTTVRDCDMIYVLENGAVDAHGTYETLAATNASFRAMAGLR